MIVWIFKGFEGHYPVGTSAVVVAESEKEACALLDVELKTRKLPTLEGQNYVRYAIDLNVERVTVIQDGDY